MQKPSQVRDNKSPLKPVISPPKSSKRASTVTKTPKEEQIKVQQMPPTQPQVIPNSTDSSAPNKKGNSHSYHILCIGRKRGHELTKKGETLIEPMKGKKHTKRSVKLRDSNSMQTYIYRVIKEIKPEFGISKSAMGLFNSILAELFDNTMQEARNLCLFHNKQTIASKEIETAIKLLYPGELGKLAVQYGRQSLQKFSENAAN